MTDAEQWMHNYVCARVCEGIFFLDIWYHQSMNYVCYMSGV